MNAVTKVTAPDRREVVEVLRNSLYPGAKPESVELVLAYCRVNGIDPMLKAVHIVPTSVKVAPDRWETRDVLMPGIAAYRIKAARSGQYAGKSEPEFGPDITRRLDDVEMTFPSWCRVTITRLVGGEPRTFAAKELWLENYATASRKTAAPNSMWRKRPYGQLAKCAEAQALRMAFPELSGGTPTAEEMEGKPLFAGPTIDAVAEKPSAAQVLDDSIPALDNAPLPPSDMVARLRRHLAAMTTPAQVLAVGDHASFRAEMAQQSATDRQALQELLADAYSRVQPSAATEGGTDLPALDEGGVP